MVRGWKEIPLGDVLKLQRGFDLPHTKRQPGDIPVVSSSGISGQHSEAKVKSPGVVTGRYGTIGEVFFVSEDFWPLNTTLFVKDFKGNNPLFISFILRTIDFKSCSDKSSVPGVNRNDLHNIEVKLPPLPEQEAIAQSLSDVDALITECDRIITKKRNTKQGTMQELITGKKRLPGFSRKSEVEEFEQVLKVVDGDRGDNYPSNEELFDNGYCLFLSAKNVTKQGFKFLECIFITKEKENLLGKGKLVKKDVVLTTRGTVGNIAFFDDSVPFENIRINSGMVILRTEGKNLDNTYLYTFLKSRLFQNQIDRAVFGSAQPQLTVKGISKFKIPISPLAEQKAIAQILTDMDAEIATLEQKRDKYKAIKQGMMQELLTGKTRLIGSC